MVGIFVKIKRNLKIKKKKKDEERKEETESLLTNQWYSNNIFLHNKFNMNTGNNSVNNTVNGINSMHISKNTCTAHNGDFLNSASNALYSVTFNTNYPNNLFQYYYHTQNRKNSFSEDMNSFSIAKECDVENNIHAHVPFMDAKKNTLYDLSKVKSKFIKAQVIENCERRRHKLGSN